LPVSSTPGAVSGNSYMDAVQEEVTGLWNCSRILLTGVGGSANAITASVVPALVGGTLIDGMSFTLKAINTNTGPVTLNTFPIVDGMGSALKAGAIVNGGVYDLMWVASANSFYIVGYFQGAGAPAGKLIASATGAGQSTIDIINGNFGVVFFDDTYDTYLIDIATAKPSSDDVELWLRVGTGGGTPTYQTSGYRHITTQVSPTGGVAFSQSASDSKLIIAGRPTATEAIGNASGENISIRVTCPNPEQGDAHTMTWNGTYIDSNGGVVAITGGGAWSIGTPITALRFQFESGLISAGRFSFYGITKG